MGVDPSPVPKRRRLRKKRWCRRILFRCPQCLTEWIQTKRGYSKGELMSTTATARCNKSSIHDPRRPVQMETLNDETTRDRWQPGDSTQSSASDSD